MPLEAITWRVVSSGPRPELRLLVQDCAVTDPSQARKGTRRAYFPELGGLAEVPVYDRYRLGAGAAFAGPAIVEERESTLIVGPNAGCHVDTQRNLVVRLNDDG